MPSPENIRVQILDLVKQYHQTKFAPITFDPDKDLVHCAGTYQTGKPLVGALRKERSYHFGRKPEYRIIYFIEQEMITVTVIGTREGIYKKVKKRREIFFTLPPFSLFIPEIDETDEIDEMKQVSCFRTYVPSVRPLGNQRPYRDARGFPLQHPTN